MRKFAKYWRDSASLMILARDSVKQTGKNSYNYKVLVFKRTEKTSFMPNSIVFPGGAVDKQDESLQWNGLFARLGGKSHLEQLENLTKIEGPRPFIFENSSSDTLDRNISLRLTALREAFEELGVLFGHTKERSGVSADGYSNAIKNFDVSTWQKSVHDGEESFAELCEKLSIAPDLLNIYEWSTWLTPAMFRKRRFETVFYLVALNEMPEVWSEPHEVAEYVWDTPSGLLQAHKDEKLWLAPPQHYELTRLSHLHDIDEIVRFSKARSSSGSTLFCPVQYICSDAAVFVLPGDDLYPENYDYITPHNADLEKFKDSTAEQFRSQVKNLHRCEHRGLNSQTYYANISPFNAHLSIHGDNKHLSKL
ncbi:acyl-coenzyme A diphosphatase NUDT19-like [Wyeomyia smithii]|uniref:acyl-coenzyme A diphosphatase NUDT19-like n=1 Tax=Wyeomyia smithii TaxID=174621 RepID=UPI002467D570|nr:acyl-coenzyme A diphosphatase NUDT19-like [Wyeomyia smithii]